MENLVFCLNATIPIFITLMLGYLFRKIGLYDDSFVSQMNKFAFKVALPAMLFLNIAEADFYEVWDTKMVVFCFGSHGMSRQMVMRTLKGIAANPIILGIVTGLVWSMLRLPLPTILYNTVNNLGKTATPLGLMAMGGALHFGKVFSRPKATIACTFLKLVGFCAIFLPIAIHLGFTHDKLVSILIMLGSATTVTCYIMAKNMGHEGSFSSSVIMLTTLLSSFTLTGWLFICRSLGLI